MPGSAAPLRRAAQLDERAFAEGGGRPRSVLRRRLTWLTPQLGAHYRRRWPAYAAFFAAVYGFHLHFTFGLNASPSLPYMLFLVVKDAPVVRGDLVAFRWHGAGPYPEGATFVKIAAGVPGDTVARDGRAYFVNGQSVGAAKTHTALGRPLEGAATGILPPGRYYVHATHPDSLDSRYALTGWIPQERIIGRAYALF